MPICPKPGNQLKSEIEKSLVRYSPNLPKSSIFYPPNGGIDYFTSTVVPVMTKLFRHVKNEDKQEYVRRILHTRCPKKLPDERVKRFCDELAWQFNLFLKNSDDNLSVVYEIGHLERAISAAHATLDFSRSITAVR